MATDIALRIGGTKYRQKGGGYNPVLVNCGVFADNNVKLDSLPTVTETPSFKLIKTSGYTLYVLNDTKIHSADASTPGFLNVAVTILSNKQLKDDKSPYELLMDVYQKFMDLYTTPESDGFKRFKDTEYDKNIFSELLQKYPLEDTKKKNVTMNPQGSPATLCVPQNKMSEFFADPQYDEFADFREIEIGSMCQTTPALAGLTIPRPIVYKVFVDGDDKGNMTNMPFSYTKKPATQDVIYPEIRFTLDELKKNSPISQNGAVIKLLRSQERIDINTTGLKGEDVKCSVSVKINGDLRYKEYAVADFKNKYNKLSLGVYDLKEAIISGEPIKLPAKNVRNAEINLQCDNDVYEITKSKSNLAKSINITLTVSKKPQKIVQTTAPIVVEQKKYVVTDNKEEKQDEKPASQKKSFSLMNFLIGIAAGLVLALGIWLGIYGIPSGDDSRKFTVDEAKEQFVKYAQLEKNLLSSNDTINLLPFKILLTDFSDEEKKIVNRYFSPENEIENVDMEKVAIFKNVVPSDWESLKAISENLKTAVKDANDEEEKGSTVFDLLYNCERDIAKYKRCSDWDVLKNKNELEYIIKTKINQFPFNKVYDVSQHESRDIQTDNDILSRAQQLSSKELTNLINNKKVNYAKKTDEEIKIINGQLKSNKNYCPNADAVIDKLFPTDIQGQQSKIDAIINKKDKKGEIIKFIRWDDVLKASNEIK